MIAMYLFVQLNKHNTMKSKSKLLVAAIGMVIASSFSFNTESNAGCWDAWYDTEASGMVCPSEGTGECTVCFKDPED